MVTNAGFMAPGYFTEQDVAAWHRTIDINVNAILSVTHAFLSEMYRRNFGRIVNISSAAGLVGVPGLAAYSASKWAVFGLTEALRLVPLLRGLLPDSTFNALGRLMGLHTSMSSWIGRPTDTDKALTTSPATTSSQQESHDE